MKQFQVELWEECNNLCKFCYLGLDNLKTPKEVKLKSISELLDRLNNKEFISQYDNISLIGGEFFQGQLNDTEVKEHFYELIQKLFYLLNENVIENCWITATLTIGDQKDLYNLLDMYSQTTVGQQKFSDSRGLWICTSYDTIGRFHTKEAEENWKFHMKKLNNYNVHKNTCIILTEDFMNKVINDEINLYNFMKEYNTELFFKQPGIGSCKTKEEMEAKINGFFPKRQTALLFFRKIIQDYPSLYDKLFNIKYRADYIERNFNDNTSIIGQRIKNSKTESITEDFNINPCGHLKEYNAYIDSDKCIFCDKINIWESLNDKNWE